MLTRSCDLPIEDLVAYGDGELRNARKEIVEAHIGTCPVCRWRLAAYADVDRVVREGTLATDDAAGRAAIKARLEREQARRGAGTLGGRDGRSPARSAQGGRGRRTHDWIPARSWRWGSFGAAVPVVLTVVIAIAAVALLGRSRFLPAVPRAAEPGVYVAVPGDQVYALHTDTGEVRWRVPAPRDLRDGASWAPVAAGGSLFLVESGRDGAVSALDSRDGSERWRRPIEHAHAPAAVGDGRVYVSASDTGRVGPASIYALDADDGKVAWERQLTPRGEVWPPAVDDGVVYVPTKEFRGGTQVRSYLTALDAGDGHTLWERDLPDLLAPEAPTVAGDALYLRTQGSAILALARDTGEVRWTSPAACCKPGGVAVGDGLVYTGRTSAGGIVALRAADGGVAWQRPMGTGGASAPLTSAGGVVYAGTGDGLHALDAGTGRELWHHRSAQVSGTPTVAGGAVYFGTSDGYLYALDAIDGSLRWRHEAGGPVGAPRAIP